MQIRQIYITVKYKLRKSIPVADAFSRVCFKEEEPVKQEIHFITAKSHPIDINTITGNNYERSRSEQAKKTLFLKDGLSIEPTKLWDYWTFRCDLVIEDGLILKGDRIIIPETLRSQVLEALHTGHQGKLNVYFLQGSQYFGQELQLT